MDPPPPDYSSDPSEASDSDADLPEQEESIQLISLQDIQQNNAQNLGPIPKCIEKGLNDHIKLVLEISQQEIQEYELGKVFNISTINHLIPFLKTRQQQIATQLQQSTVQMSTLQSHYKEAMDHLNKLKSSHISTTAIFAKLKGNTKQEIAKDEARVQDLSNQIASLQQTMQGLSNQLAMLTSHLQQAQALGLSLDMNRKALYNQTKELFRPVGEAFNPQQYHLAKQQTQLWQEWCKLQSTSSKMSTAEKNLCAALERLTLAQQNLQNAMLDNVALSYSYRAPIRRQARHLRRAERYWNRAINLVKKAIATGYCPSLQPLLPNLSCTTNDITILSNQIRMALESMRALGSTSSLPGKRLELDVIRGQLLALRLSLLQQICQQRGTALPSVQLALPPPMLPKK